MKGELLYFWAENYLRDGGEEFAIFRLPIHQALRDSPQTPCGALTHVYGKEDANSLPIIRYV